MQGLRAHALSPLGLTVAVALSGCAATVQLSEPSAETTPTAAANASPATLAAGETELDAGTYRLDLTGLTVGSDPYPEFSVTVSEGWLSMDGWALARPSSADDTPSVAVTFWDVDEVYANSCDWREAEVEIGDGVDDLVDALLDVPDRRPSDPEPVEVDGYEGTYLEWSVPQSLAFDEKGNFASCDGDGTGNLDFRSWTGAGWASTRYHQGPGQVDRLWVLDVDGQRLVIDAFSMPWATADEVDELMAIVESITFDD